PQAQELQEGVAFHGRAGNALIKSLQRLHVDPMEVYGTNAVKFAGCDLALAAEWLRRELRIVEPKLLVVMGDDARSAGRPRHRLLTRRGSSEDSVLERIQDRRPLVGRPAALLGLALFAALLVYYEIAPDLWQASVWWDVAWLAFVLIPAVFGLVLVALPLREAPWLLPAGLAFAVLAVVLTIADADVFANFARLAACACLGWWFLGYFEDVSW